MSKGKVLVVGSNATRFEIQGGWAATGNYLNETVIPAMAVVGAGYEIVFATPSGARPHIDEASDSVAHFGNDQATYARAKTFWETDPAMNRVRTLRSVIEEGLENYIGVFVPGGHAPVVDLMQDYDLGTILRHFHQQAKPTALLCHGPIATLAALPYAREFRAALIAGDEAKAREWAKDWQYAGYRMSVFSETEEKVVEDNILHVKLYFNMPQALAAAGGVVQNTAANFQPNVVVDRELITGQNPSSDHPIAAQFVAALDAASGANVCKAA